MKNNIRNIHQTEVCMNLEFSSVSVSDCGDVTVRFNDKTTDSGVQLDSIHAVFFFVDTTDATDMHYMTCARYDLEQEDDIGYIRLLSDETIERILPMVTALMKGHVEKGSYAG